MKKKTNKPLMEHERQLLPLEGEVSLKDARFKAYSYAAKIKARLKSQGAKLK